MSELDRHPDIVLPPTATLRQAMETLTRTTVGIVLVAGPDRRLLGILVDSDIRKALLAGTGLDTPLEKSMNAKPFTAPADSSREALANMFRQRRRAYIPLVDAAGKVAGLASMAEILAVPQGLDNLVVIMAGGLGTRLRPFTDNMPKPMMPVGGRPLLEHLIENLVSHGFSRFTLALNYMGDAIRAHFGDGSRWGVNIQYVEETERRGTAGALSLLPAAPSAPLLVMNADLLTKVNFQALVDFHLSEKNLATVCLREYDFQVPYGVAQIQDHKLVGMVEKPVHRFHVNAGIYVLDPEVLALVPKSGVCDMPELLEKVRAKRGDGVGCFPIQEYWLDIGRLEDYDRAQREYGEQFQ
jgi:dTDP-glucose pyrophosphorylase